MDPDPKPDPLVRGADPRIRIRTRMIPNTGFYRSYRSCFDGRLIVEHVERVRDVQIQTLFRSQTVQRHPAARLQRKRGDIKGTVDLFQIPSIILSCC